MAIYKESVSWDDGSRYVPALTAAGGPMKPPDEWFDDPKLDKPTPLTVTKDGRVYGHLAAWNTRHVGLPGNVHAPKSKSNYAYFKKGVVETASGKDIQVGQLTLAGGHAPLTANAKEAAKHYDDTNSAVADLNVGEDEHGIWLAGSVRPGLSDTQFRALRASVPSGDWRPFGRDLELVAACQVNVPGFPIPRLEARIASGAPVAIVAAGSMDMALRKYGIHSDEGLETRVAELEALVASLQGYVISSEKDNLYRKMAK